MTSSNILLRQPLPAGRSLEQVWNHYQVEKSLAEQLKATDRIGRARIYETMYDELFRQVPDHPRLSRRRDAQATARANQSKWALLQPVVGRDQVVLEFGSGDCAFLSMVAKQVRTAFAVDISDQREPEREFPANLHHVVYDGFHLDRIEPASVDIAFSDQLVEHLHPEETANHMRLVAGLLRPGGCYVVNTPHAMNGPHDVSKYFSDVAEGFHLKEWTFAELATLMRASGFTAVQARWFVRRWSLPMPMPLVRVLEVVLGRLPYAGRRRLSRYLLPTVAIIARKAG